MACSRQPILTDFFKTKKNNRNDYKNGKTLKKLKLSHHKEVQLDAKPVKKVLTEEKTTTCPLKSEPWKGDQSTSVGQTSSYVVTSVSEVEETTSPLKTPKRKGAGDEVGERKRIRREKIVMDASLVTPSQATSLKLTERRMSSARKRLDMKPAEKSPISAPKDSTPVKRTQQETPTPAEVPKSPSEDPPAATSPKPPSSPQKKMTAEEFRSKLQNCKQLGSLQEALKKMNSTDKKLADLKKKFSSSAPISEPAKEREEPKVTSLERLAAAPTTLALPLKYRLLFDVFNSVETVVGIMHNRHEQSTFTKIKPLVQQMTKKSFNMSHLGQIKTVHPEAYIFQQEKTAMRQFNSRKAGEYDLTVIPNFSEEVNSENQRPETLPVPSSSNKSVIKNAEKKDFPVMNAQLRVQRKTTFHNKLIGIVKGFHEKFLQSSNPSIPLDISSKLTKWHPKFKLEEVPDIVPASLPLPPDAPVVSSAKDVLEKLGDTYRGSRLEKALQSTAQKFGTDPKNDPPTGSPSTATTPQEKRLAAALKGLPASLIEKIKAKEAAKLQREMTRNPVETAKLGMMERLPKFARTLRMYVLGERKSTVTFEGAAVNLSDSSMSAISIDECREHIKMLVELVPEWISTLVVNKVAYVKINKDSDINQVVSKLEQLHKSKL